MLCWRICVTSIATITKIQTLERADRRIISMFGYSCKDCHALLAKMHSAIMEANAITENAKAVRLAGNRRSPHVPEWWEIKEAWETAHRRWMLASTDFKTHVATHHSTPISAKMVAKV